MKHKILRNILLWIGIVPFVLPVLVGIYKINSEPWTMPDWMILYSFLYWPTYLIGAALIITAVVLYRKERKKQKNGKTQP